MSKFDLRDISERLTNSSDSDGVVFEFLGYLQALHGDWRASLAFYEVSRDSLENIYERHGNRLVRREVNVPVDKLPARLVRKFFHPSAFFNQAKRRSILAHFMHSSPTYELAAGEAAAMRPLAPLASWQSCVCVSLMDRDDVLAMLVIASDRKNALPQKWVDEILPIKSMAAMALVQHLHRAAPREGALELGDARMAAAEFQERIRSLNQEATHLEEDNRAKSERLEALSGQVEQLDRNSSAYKQELDRVKGTISALEEQSQLATSHLSEAYTQLGAAQKLASDLERTVGFMRTVCQMLAQEHDPHEFSRTTVTWLCEEFGVERCSLMTLDPSGETLQIAAQHGIDPEIAARVKVRVGQGVAGWVASNRKPLLVRVEEEIPAVERAAKETYNSDSFICVPLNYDGQVAGILSLSNKSGGEPFEGIDLDRATMVATVLAMLLVGRRRSLAAATSVEAQMEASAG